MSRLYNILNALTTRGVRAKLVWSNPNGITSLTSTMGSETVTIDDMTGYDSLLVEFRKRYNQSAKVCDLSITGTSGLISEVACISTNSNPILGFYRGWYRSDVAKVHFDDCTRTSSSAAAVTGSDKGCLVPIRIFALKLGGGS